MVKTIGALVGILLIGAVSLPAGRMQFSSVQARRLDKRIGPAAAQKYRSVRDAKDWENPYLVVGRDGIEVIVRRLPSSRTTVAAVDLEPILVGLPISAWPYGRVAAVQEVGIREPDRSDDKSIAANLEAVLAILKKLDITVDRWPS